MYLCFLQREGQTRSVEWRWAGLCNIVLDQNLGNVMKSCMRKLVSSFILSFSILILSLPPQYLVKVMLNVTVCRHLRGKKKTLFYTKLFQKFGFIFEASIALIPKPEKRHYKKGKLLLNVSREHRSQKVQQNVSK